MQQKSFDLNNLKGMNGFTMSGVAASGRLGWSVSTAADVNGDGLSDFILVAPFVNSVGIAYVVFGSRTGFPAFFDLNNLNGTNGFTVQGLGGELSAISGAGDINGDGLNDLVFGSGLINSARGASYIILGSRGTFPASFNLTTLNGTNGFTVPGIAINDYLGSVVGAAGDINGDGIDDLILVAYLANSSAGASYIIFGRRSGFSAIFNLNTLNGVNGFTIPGIVSGGYLGYAANGLGDINGDGISDLGLAAGSASGSTGTVYVIFGSRTSFPSSFNLATLNGVNGFTVPGVIPDSATPGGSVGHSISSASDINGDGLSDLVFAAVGVNANTGIGYVIFGSRAGFPASFNLNMLNGANGFAIPAVLPSGSLGYSVNTAGDVNNDGISDFILGAPNVNLGATTAAGISYLIFGNRNGFPASFNLTNLNGSNGFTIPGLTIGGGLGSSVSTAGDVNGDEISDLILGAFRVNSNVGAGYVIFGGFASIVFIKNELTIKEGQTILLSNANLNFMGLVPTELILFIVNQVQGGRFTLVSNPNVTIANFTPTQLNNSQIQFISDRTNPVAYQVGIANATNGQVVFAPISANVTFINNAPVILNAPSTEVVVVDQPFNFVLFPEKIFNDTDGDPLTYSAQLRDRSAWPSWLDLNTNQSNQFTFSGIAPMKGSTQISLIAKDPLNASISADFEILAVPNNATNNNVANENNSLLIGAAQIAGGVVGGIFGLGALIGAGLGFWRYTTNKNSRSNEPFADSIRTALNLKGIDNFDQDTGQKYLNFVHSFQKSLQTVGIDPNTMRPLELRQLADDVADAARNKISPATDCLGRSVVTVTDLNDNLQSLVSEVQILRNKSQERGYTI